MVGPHDQLLNIAPLFGNDCFAEAFIAFFSLPCYFLTLCGIYFSIFLLVQNVFNFLLKFYMPKSIECIDNISIVIDEITKNFAESSRSWIFNYTTSKTSNDFTWRWTWQASNKNISTFWWHSYFSKVFSSKLQTNSVTKNQKPVPQFSEINATSISFLFDQSEYKRIEPESINTLPLTLLNNTKLSIAISSLDNDHIT